MKDISYSEMVKDGDTKWRWIMETIYEIIETQNLLDKLPLSPDDVVQDTVRYMLERKKKNGVDLAEFIYNDKENNMALLVSFVKICIDESNGNQYYDNNTDFLRYKKIHSVCSKYNIPEEPNNAYMISAIINEKLFSIPLVEQILLKKKPKQVSYDKYAEEYRNTM